MINLIPSWFRRSPEEIEAREMLRIIGDVLYSGFGLYSDKASLFGRYQFPLRLLGPPIIVAGWLKIPIDTRLLPKGVFREQLEDPRLISALRVATGRNVEVLASDRLVLPSLILERARSTPKNSSGWFGSVDVPTAFDFWFAVELDSMSLRGIPRLVEFDDIPPPNPDHNISWPIGQVVDGSVMMADYPSEIISMIVGGATRQGKSSYLRSCLNYVRKHYDKSRFFSLLADFKRSQTDFRMFHGDDRFRIVSSPSELVETVDRLDVERSQILRESGAFNIFDYNAHTSTPLPYIFVVVDEFAALRLILNTASRRSKEGQEQKSLFNRILVFVATTAASGIYWTIGTQRPDVEVVPGGLKTNIVTRLCFSMPTAVDAGVVFGDERLGEFCVSLGCPGRGFVSFGDMFFEFQAPFSDILHSETRPQADVSTNVK